MFAAAWIAAACVVAHSAAGQNTPPETGEPARPTGPEPQKPPGQPVESDSPDAYEGRMIREVRLLTPVKKGDKTVNEPVSQDTASLVRNQLRTRAGAPYRRQTVTDDLTRMNRLGGRFKTIDSLVQLQTDNSVVVTFLMVEQPVIVDVQAVGNRLVSDQEIADVVGNLTGTAVDRLRIDRGAQAIEDVYRTKGYYLARVTVDEKELNESGILLYRIFEGERVKVTLIAFEGNNSFSAKELRSAIKTTEAGIFETGPLDDQVLDEDTASLVHHYRDRGYIDVAVGRRTQPSPNGKEVAVTFFIDEGPLYTLRSVRAELGRLSGDRAVRRFDPGKPLTVFSEAQIAGLLGIKAGDVFSVDKLGKSLRGIRGAYGALGYYEANVDRLEVRAVDKPEVDLIVLVYEGKPSRTGLINITGNDLTRQDVIRHRVLLTPERPLDSTARDETIKRLDATRLFAPGSVRVVPQEPSAEDPERRDVLVEVQEHNTGSFNIGGAVSSDGGLVGTISLTQNNFDITDFPDSWGEFVSGNAFRGGGQVFRLELAPGDITQNYSISLSEPHVFDSNYSLGGSLYYRAREFDDYNEGRYGVSLSTGREFGSLWRGGFTLRDEIVDIFDIEPSAPVDVFNDAGNNHISGLGFALTRNTLDNNLRPSRGTKSSAGVEQVGVLGGDYWFTKLAAEHVIYLTINESFDNNRTVFSMNTKASYIPQNSNDVPVYERYYLGGQSFRGFAYRAVSPVGIRNDTGTLGDEPVGGTWMFFWGVQVQQPLYREYLSIVFFMDTGTVTDSPFFDEYRVSVGTGFRIFIPQLSPVPLAFDFGFPLLRQDTDRERVFTFGIDVPLR